MKIVPADIPDILVIQPRVFEDERGFFFESWNRRNLAEVGVDDEFVQDNHSFSTRGTLRGLHYQVENTQGKLVRVVAGKVYDVALDLRRSSRTFGKWVGTWLSSENHRMLWVPPGFAHGFCVASESVHLLYKCTDYYSPQAERTIAWDDPELAIDWPLADGAPPLLARKDREGVPFRHAEYFE